ncbi:DUF4129 domain-containing protein [Streptomyces sp. NPDC047000]|uniref:DUF4129 domain-containing protein n=1 Tax=Streptomyces sp. NPDC047000 TaxID=3155474 RepID=UPI0033FDD4AE
MSWTGGVLTAVPALPHPAGAAVHALLHGPGALLPTLARTDAEPPVTVPRDPAQKAARRELAKRLYHENDPSLYERALNAFWDWLGRLFGAASSAAPGGAVGLTVIALAVVAVVVALWWRLGTPRRQALSAPALFGDRPRTAAEHRAAAEAHAAQGHWNPALQERMRAVVRALEERALLDVRPGRTADEAAADAARALPAHTDRLRAAAREFDDVTYGGRRASEEAYRHVAALDHDLERTRPVHAGSAATARPAADSGRWGGPR